MSKQSPDQVSSVPCPAYAVVLAGGGGTRLWPSSRRTHPKQLLSLGGKESLIAATVRRAGLVCGADRVLVVTADDQKEQVALALPGLNPEQILSEPEPRNTAPAIALAAMYAASRGEPDAVLAIMPSDAWIRSDESFAAAARRGIEHAADSIVTIGIRPAHAETGFGYIHAGDAVAPTGGTVADASDQPVVREIRAFKEKPSEEVARTYCESGEHFWNAGMFFLTARRLADEIARHMPLLSKLVTPSFTDPPQAANWEERVAAGYSQVENTSIDYGIMEKVTGPRRVVLADFGWSDVGSWDALSATCTPDEQGNHSIGQVTAVDAHRNALVSEDGAPRVCVVGVSDLVVVATPDAVLVVPRDKAQDVRKIVEELKKGGHTNLV